MLELILAVGRMLKDVRYRAYGFTSVFYRLMLYIPCNDVVRMHLQWCASSEYNFNARDNFARHYLFSTKKNIFFRHKFVWE